MLYFRGKMARKKDEVTDTDRDRSNTDDPRRQLLNRRSYLQWTGATAASALALTGIGAAHPNESGKDGSDKDPNSGGKSPKPDPDPCEEVPLDVMLVLDRSGSMAQDSDNDGSTKLQEVQNAVTGTPANGFLDRLTSTDRAGLVKFNDTTPQTPDQGLTDNFGAVETAVSALTPSGGTDISAGIESATEELTTNGRSSAIPIMVVLSNGRSNVNPDNAAQQAKAAGIRLITVAFGQGADTSTLMQIASDPTDENFFEAGPNTIDNIFETISRELCSDDNGGNDDGNDGNGKDGHHDHDHDGGNKGKG
jgi:hypothetical protein